MLLISKQQEKASESILFNDDGSVGDAMSLHSRNARFPMTVSPSFNSISCMLLP